jgi:hypothetical protein
MVLTPAKNPRFLAKMMGANEFFNTNTALEMKSFAAGAE